MSEWYYVEGGERQGPITHQVLVSRIGHGALPPDVLVWRDGMGDWAAAHSVVELATPAEGMREATSGMAVASPYQAASSVAMAEGGFDPFTGEHHGVMAIEYAGFWKRLVAYIIDSFILQALGFVLQLGFMALAAIPGDFDNEAFALGAALFLSLVSIALFLVYYAAFESGKWQGTPGKKVLGIKVTDTNGRRITFARALGRNVGKFFSALILMIGYLMAGFTEKKQALHDMMAGCLVISA